MYGGVFGLLHYSQSAQKIGLVGTLARIKSRTLLEDGRAFVVIEGFERFYLQEIVGEKPYFKGRVQRFKDITETPESLYKMEMQIFNEVRTNVKMMELLYPNKNYTLSSKILELQPPLLPDGVRSINLAGDEYDLKRRSKLSFAIVDMLQINPSTKLALLQVRSLPTRRLFAV
jgi:ATP-dependent Lon protease